MDHYSWLIIYSFLCVCIVYLYSRYCVALNLLKQQQKLIESYSDECDEHYLRSKRVVEVTKIAQSYGWIICLSQSYKYLNARYDISRITTEDEAQNGWRYQVILDLSLESVESFFSYYEMTRKNGIENPSLIDVAKVRDKFQRVVRKLEE